MSDPLVAWHAQAACLGVDNDLFFEDRYYDQAVAMCMGCPVRITCLLSAISRRESYGVFGGMDIDQRKQYFQNCRKAGQPLASCGTERGYQQHMSFGEPVCETCKSAHLVTLRNRSHQ